MVLNILGWICTYTAPEVISRSYYLGGAKSLETDAEQWYLASLSADCS